MMPAPSYRQMDHWTSSGYLKPLNGRNPGSGNRRKWSEHEQAVAALIWRLRLAGLNLPTAARAARTACDVGSSVELAPGVWLEVRSP